MKPLDAALAPMLDEDVLEAILRGEKREQQNEIQDHRRNKPGGFSGTETALNPSAGRCLASVSYVGEGEGKPDERNRH
jgi:hypothetical protein